MSPLLSKLGGSIACYHYTFDVEKEVEVFYLTPGAAVVRLRKFVDALGGAFLLMASCAP